MPSRSTTSTDVPEDDQPKQHRWRLLSFRSKNKKASREDVDKDKRRSRSKSRDRDIDAASNDEDAVLSETSSKKNKKEKKQDRKKEKKKTKTSQDESEIDKISDLDMDEDLVLEKKAGKKKDKAKGTSKKSKKLNEENDDVGSDVQSIDVQKQNKKSQEKEKNKEKKKNQKSKFQRDDKGDTDDSKDVTIKSQKKEKLCKEKILTEKTTEKENEKDDELSPDDESQEEEVFDEPDNVPLGAGIDEDGTEPKEVVDAGLQRRTPSVMTNSEYASTGSFDKTLSSGGATDDITIVTAYFDIGNVHYGESKKKRTPSMFKEWMKGFSKIANPVVAYFDTESAAHKFREYRSHFSSDMTKIVQVDKTRMWAFALRDEVARVLRSPLYPKFNPSTTNPEFICVTHAKYELMDDAIHSDYFNTRFYAWMDCNLFKDSIKSSGPMFQLGFPENFDHHNVAYSQIKKKNDIYSHVEIIKTGQSWISGGFFLARRDVMKMWTQEYRSYIHKFMDMSIMSSDQHCIYAMFAPRLYSRPRVGIQAYNAPPKSKVKPHLYLPDLCRKGWEQEQGGGKDGVDCVVM